MTRIIIFFILSYLFLLRLSGCAPSGIEVVSETDEKQYQLGQDYKGQGRMENALSAFLRVIDARRDAPESHLEAGYIYLRTMKDPVRSIYHFDRYLQFKPQSAQSAQVRQLIETAKKEFARQLPADPFEGELDRIDLMDLVKTLKLENDDLKRELMGAIARVEQLENVLGNARRASPIQTVNLPDIDSVTNELPTNPSNLPRSYTVQSGDTLSAISKRFYGTSTRYIDIFQANRDRLSSEGALRVGQVIRIP
ncbi:MAG: LysM peptidoglycan-binding domain-containing protein [Verrucomicrobiota bacterium]|nr:LysM peptidoglycan-binding domain-containing protein [Verrucomicrobiota bacterium]